MNTIMPAPICVVGMGHLGLVTAACLAEWQHQVIGVDLDAARVSDLRHGRPPLFEPGLTGLIQRQSRAGRLSFTSELATAVKAAAYVWVALDTPSDERDQADLGPVYQAILTIAAVLGPRTPLLLSSPVPIGTCERLWAAVERVNPCAAGGIVYLPSSLPLGSAIERFQQPDMLVIGAESPSLHQRVRQLLEPLQAPTMLVSLRTAETINHAISSSRAAAIGVAHELGNLSERLGVDRRAVVQALRLDRRFGEQMMSSPGFVSDGLSRDLKALQHAASSLNCRTPLLDATLVVNEIQRCWPVERLTETIELNGARIGLLGLTQLPHTSVLRGSPAIRLIHDLRRRGALVKAYDPLADLTELGLPLLFELCADPYQAAERCDALVLITAWPEFAALDLARLRTALRQPYLLDIPQLLDPAALEQQGLIDLTAHSHGMLRELRRCA